MVVVDTSVIVKWFIPEDGHIDAVRLLKNDLKLACPDFALAEVANALGRKIRVAEISPDQAGEAVIQLPKYFDLIVPSKELLSSSFALAAKLDHSVYDCMFLALAIREPSEVVVTSDSVFLRKCITAGFGNSIQHLKDYVALLQAKSETSDG
jgi:predicted nucleic acid-binding protein